MPRYFFNVFSVVEGATKNIAKDSEGVALDSVGEVKKEAIGFARDLVLRRPRSFEQNFRVDKWNVYRGYAATRSGSFVK